MRSRKHAREAKDSLSRGPIPRPRGPRAERPSVALRDSRLPITRCEQPSSIGADVSITCSLAAERERAAARRIAPYARSSRGRTLRGSVDAILPARVTGKILRAAIAFGPLDILFENYIPRLPDPRGAERFNYKPSRNTTLGTQRRDPLGTVRLFENPSLTRVPGSLLDRDRRRFRTLFPQLSRRRLPTAPRKCFGSVAGFN